MRAFRRRNRPRVGVAIAGGEILAARSHPPNAGHPPSIRRVEYVRTPSPDGKPSLDEALHSSLADLPVGSRLTFALLPDLVEVRRVQHPPMSARHLRAHLSRRAERYLVSPGAFRTVAFTGFPDEGGARWIAFAESEVVTSLYRMVRTADVELEAIVPAIWGWCQSACGRSDDGPSPQVQVVPWPTPEGEPALHVVAKGSGGSLRYRRFPDTSVGRVALSDVLAPADPESVHGRSAGPIEIRDPLRDAALGAMVTPDSAPRLVAEEQRSDRRRRTRRASAALAGTSAIFLLVAAAAHLLGLRRELGVLESERARLAAPVVEASEVRSRTEYLSDALTALRGTARAAPRWSEVLAATAEVLPSSAHLTSFRGAGDTLVVQGVAAEARDVVTGMSDIRGMVRLRMVGPLRRDVLEGDRVIERFRIAASIDRGGRTISQDTTVDRDLPPPNPTRADAPAPR